MTVRSELEAGGVARLQGAAAIGRGDEDRAELGVEGGLARAAEVGGLGHRRGERADSRREHLPRLGPDRDLDLARRAGRGRPDRQRAETDRAVGQRDGVEQHRLAHEAGDEFAPRPLVELARRADLRHLAALHDDDAVAHRHRLLLVVRHVGDGQAEALLQAADLLAHRAAQAGIEVRERLVEQQHRRLEDERARERDALLLAAGELARQALVHRHQADRRHRRAGPLARQRAGDAGDAQAVGDVGEHVHVRKERVALEHHADVALGRRQIGDVAAGDDDPAAGRRLEPGDHPQRRRLAAAARAEQRRQGPARNAKADLVDGQRPVRIAAVALGDGAEFDPVARLARGRVARFVPSAHAGCGTRARRPSVRSPTSQRISAIASDISAISTVQ